MKTLFRKGKLKKIAIKDMSDDNLDFALRRAKFIEACAYYVVLKGISVDQLEMTQELADLITERLRSAQLEWAIGSIRGYKKLLDDGMEETMPDVDGSLSCNGLVLRYNFRSLVANEVHEKQTLFQSQKRITNVVENETPHAPKSQQLPMPSAAPREFLMGFSVLIKPDAHLDEQIPICARDQHLLYNIFGKEWTSPVVISAYTAIKGQTGYMQNWLPKK